MKPKNKTEKYLEDNMDMIFGTECMNGSFDIELRNKLENDLEINKEDKFSERFLNIKNNNEQR